MALVNSHNQDILNGLHWFTNSACDSAVCKRNWQNINANLALYGPSILGLKAFHSKLDIDLENVAWNWNLVWFHNDVSM